MNVYGREPTPRALPRLKPNEDLCPRFRRKLHLQILASYTNPKAKKYFPSRASCEGENLRQYLSKEWYIIHPFSAFRMYWEFIMVICWIFVLPYEIFAPAFIVRLSLEKSNLDALYLITFVLNGVCNVDVILNFFTGYYDKSNESIILNQRKIIIHYLCTYFLPDLLSFTQIYYLIVFNGVLSAKNFRIFYCLQFLRIIRLRSVHEFADNFHQLYQLNTAIFVCLSWIVGTLYIVHFNACGLCLVSDIVRSYMGPSNRTWIAQLEQMYAEQHKTFISQYLYCHAVYEVLRRYAFGNGYTRIRMLTQEDVIMANFTVICGRIYTIWVIVRMYNWLKSMYSSALYYDKTYAAFKNYMRHEGIPEEEQERLLRNFAENYDGVFYNISLIRASLRELPAVSENTVVAEQLLKDCPMFEEIPDDLISKLTSKLKLDLILEGEEIEINAFIDCVYFILAGSFSYYSNQDDETYYLEDGDSFGGNVFLVESTILAIVKALENSRVYLLSKDQLEFVFKPGDSEFNKVVDNVKYFSDARIF